MLIDRKRLRERVAPLLDRLGADFGPDTPVERLSIAQRQLVEIAKALSIDARIIIMDEPTSSLTLQETERLLQVIGDLRANGVSIIYISHRLGEVKACADRVVCLRDGRIVGELARDEIAHGNDDPADDRARPEVACISRPPRSRATAAATWSASVTKDFPDRQVNLSIRHGEILGLAGLVGSGRTSLARAMFGIDPIAGRRDPAGRDAGDSHLAARRRSARASTWCRRTASAPA